MKRGISMHSKTFGASLAVAGALVIGITGCSAGKSGSPVAQPTVNPVSLTSTARIPEPIFKRGRAETPEERAAKVDPDLAEKVKAETGIDPRDPLPPELRQPQGGQR